MTRERILDLENQLADLKSQVAQLTLRITRPMPEVSKIMGVVDSLCKSEGPRDVEEGEHEPGDPLDDCELEIWNVLPMNSDFSEECDGGTTVLSLEGRTSVPIKAAAFRHVAVDVGMLVWLEKYQGRWYIIAEVGECQEAGTGSGSGSGEDTGGPGLPTGEDTGEDTGAETGEGTGSGTGTGTGEVVCPLGWELLPVVTSIELNEDCTVCRICFTNICIHPRLIGETTCIECVCDGSESGIEGSGQGPGGTDTSTEADPT